MMSSPRRPFPKTIRTLGRRKFKSAGASSLSVSMHVASAPVPRASSVAVFALVLGLMCTLSPHAWGALFPTTYTYPVAGGSASSVAIGEVTGDGNKDLAVTNGGNVTVFPGVAGGAPGTPGIDYPTGGTGDLVRILDLTGDGVNDLVTNDYDGGAIVVLPGLPGGGFGPALRYGSGFAPYSFAIGDLNGDGIRDIAAVNVSFIVPGFGEFASVMLGLPGGGFGPVINYPAGVPGDTFESIAIGDLDGDGRKDLALGRANDRPVILYGLPGGGYGPPTLLDPSGSPYSSYIVAVGDLNLDGRLDLAAANDDGVVVYYGQPGGTMGGRTDYVVPGDVESVVFADLNGDGRLEIVMGAFLTIPPTLGSVVVLYNLPGGGFGPPVSYKAALGAWLLDVGDLDGNGAPDIATANFDVAAAGVVLNPVGGGATPYSSGGNFHFGVALGDLDGDTRPDIAVSNGTLTFPNQATVFNRIPGDGFTASASYGATKVARTIATGDVNGDGIPDLVEANSGATPTTTPGTVSVLLGLPGGTYGSNTDYPVGVNPLDMALVDLDGDGRLDIVTANSSSNDMSVLLGQAGGTFGPETRYPAGPGPTAVGVGDFDADGQPDLAVLGSISVSILPGLPGGGFGAQVSLGFTGFPGASIAVADLNTDGILDLAIATRGSVSASSAGKASVYLGLGGAAFSAPSNYTTSAGANCIAAGDLDGDGVLDLAVGCLGPLPSTAGISILLGLPGGGYGPTTTYGTFASRAVKIGDMDGDGRPDLGTVGSVFAGIVPNTGPALAVNHAPAITATAATTVAAGDPIHLMATALDADALQKVTITSAVSPPAPWLLQTGGASAALAVVTASRSAGAGISTGGVYTITWTATDNTGATSTAVSVLTVTSSNQAPVVTIGSPASGAVFAVGTPVAFAGSFTDDAGDTHTATWSFDALNTPGAVNEGTGAVTASYTFTTPGVYSVSLTVTDNHGNLGTATTVGEFAAMVVIYDPNAGFVTGGGWINSPAGAYPASPSSVGKANFGFVSKYKKGASIPTGESEFTFNAVGMSFHSSVYEWLVIAGARAQYKGSGAINGDGDYGFMLTAIDGQINGGGGIDKLRMKIWDHSSGAIVYDNQMGASDGDNPVTALGGGSVVIHANGGAAAGESPTLLENTTARFALLPNSPNPFNPETTIAFEVPTVSSVGIRIFDTAGRLVATLVDGVMNPGRHTATWNGRTQAGASAASGRYYVRMDAGGHRETQGITLLK